MKPIKLLLIPILIIVAISCRENLVEPNENIVTIEPIVSDVQRLVQRPNWADEIKLGTRFEISWIMSADVQKVNIYLFNEDQYIYTIVESTQNDLKFKWNVPESLELSSKYRIKVESSPDRSIHGFSQKFRVVPF